MGGGVKPVDPLLPSSSLPPHQPAYTILVSIDRRQSVLWLHSSPQQCPRVHACGCTMPEGASSSDAVGFFPNVHKLVCGSFLMALQNCMSSFRQGEKLSGNWEGDMLALLCRDWGKL